MKLAHFVRRDNLGRIVQQADLPIDPKATNGMGAAYYTAHGWILSTPPHAVPVPTPHPAPPAPVAPPVVRNEVAMKPPVAPAPPVVPPVEKK